MTMIPPLNSFIFMRHGETDWNLMHIGMGQKDIPLNDTGLRQAENAAELLQNVEFETIVSSPLQRAYKTAEIVATHKSMSITTIDELKECGLGKMEGQPKGDGSWLEKWRQDEPIDDAETFSEFTHRVLNGLSKALKLPGPVLIIAHRGVYWPILECLNLPFNDLKNCYPVAHRAPQKQSDPWFVYDIIKENTG